MLLCSVTCGSHPEWRKSYQKEETRHTSIGPGSTTWPTMNSRSCVTADMIQGTVQGTPCNNVKLGLRR
uniref:Uncharacterized protein n=1 Tax=Arundo donax TaxID=35708 RepID=A0A0A8YJX2_ARUDO